MSYFYLFTCFIRCYGRDSIENDFVSNALIGQTVDAYILNLKFCFWNENISNCLFVNIYIWRMVTIRIDFLNSFVSFIYHLFPLQVEVSHYDEHHHRSTWFVVTSKTADEDFVALKWKKNLVDNNEQVVLNWIILMNLSYQSQFTQLNDRQMSYRNQKDTEQIK